MISDDNGDSLAEGQDDNNNRQLKMRILHKRIDVAHHDSSPLKSNKQN